MAMDSSKAIEVEGVGIGGIVLIHTTLLLVEHRVLIVITWICRAQSLVPRTAVRRIVVQSPSDFTRFHAVIADVLLAVYQVSITIVAKRARGEAGVNLTIVTTLAG